MNTVIYFTVPAIPAYACVIGVAVAAGIGFGLVGWIGIKIWSAILSIQARHGVQERGERE